MDSAGIKVGIDTGGTFTDFVAILEDGRIIRHKEQSNRADPSAPVEVGLRALQKIGGWKEGTPLFVVHGTTIALNAILQGKIAKMALVVSRGFRDVLEFGRQKVPDPFSLTSPHPKAIIERNRVIEIGVRIGSDGLIRREASEEELDGLCARIRSLETEAIVVALINAYANPQAEADVAARIAHRIPNARITTSTAIWPEFREYERTMAAIVNAAVHPLMDEYLLGLARRVESVAPGSRLLLTTSSGGVIGVETARARPVETLLSGPASGTVAASQLARKLNIAEAVTFDMGGTSADIAVLREGEAERLNGTHVGDIPIMLPVVGVSSIGAGGGSILRVDSGGMLKIGPESAGSDPGPVAFDQGGERPTVTDCYIAVGIIDPDTFLGGRKKLNGKKAIAALGRIATELGLASPFHAADAALSIVTASMATELQKLLAERGHDPDRQTIIPFGGAGPTHAVMLAAEVGLSAVVVPTGAATFCALGAVVADLRRDWIRSLGRGTSASLPQSLWRIWSEQERVAHDWLASEGVPTRGFRYIYAVDIRYRGQSHHLTVEIPAAVRKSQRIDEVGEAFHHEHERLYGFRESDDRIDIVSVRLSVVGSFSKPEEPAASIGKPDCGARSARQIFCNGTWINADIYERDDLAPGAQIRGAAVIQQNDTTLWIPPGWECDAISAEALSIKRVAGHGR